MCRPMYICTGFTTCICPAFYAVIILINILAVANGNVIAGCSCNWSSSGQYVRGLAVDSAQSQDVDSRHPTQSLQQPRSSTCDDDYATMDLDAVEDYVEEDPDDDHEQSGDVVASSQLVAEASLDDQGFEEDADNDVGQSDDDVVESSQYLAAVLHDHDIEYSLVRPRQLS